MKGFWKRTGMEALLCMREPMASFFTPIVPLLLFLFGSIYGDNPNPFRPDLALGVSRRSRLARSASLYSQKAPSWHSMIRMPRRSAASPTSILGVP